MKTKNTRGSNVGTLFRKFSQTGKTCAAAAILAAASLAPLSSAHAGATVSFGEDKSISLGLGMRTSFQSVENGSPDGKHRSADFSLNSTRIYAGGSLSKYVKGTVNTEIDGGDRVRVIDAIAQFEFMDEFNVWVGRMLPPSDRANLDGPYYENAWDYPDISNYPNRLVGRDDGLTVWGKVMDKKLLYAFGVFQGSNRSAALSNHAGNPLFAGRLQFAFLEPEGAPAYYTGSTYYGSSKILTLAFAGMYQNNGVGTAARAHNYESWNIDLLFEYPLEGAGTVTVEGAYYNYNTGKDAVLELLGSPGDGKAYLATGAFMFPEKVGWGFVQPFVRYQHAKSDTFGTKGSRLDVGVNYVISGPNLRISAVYSDNANVGGAAGTFLINPVKKDKFLLGLQAQF
jgi:hypothetical protein